MEPVKKLLLRFPSVKLRDTRSLLQGILFGLITIGLGLFTASMIVKDEWQFAAVVIFSIPAIFVLQRYPFLSILIWLIFIPFFLHTTSATSRQIYWVIHRFLPILTLGAILLPSALGKKTLPKLGLPEWSMLFYVAVSLYSILFTNLERQNTTYLFYDRIIIPMVLYLVVRLSSPDERMIRWLIPVALFIAVSQIGIGVVSWFAPRALPAKWVDYESHRTIGTLVNTNAYVTTLVLVGLLVLHYGLQSSSNRLRLVSIFIFLLTSYGIFISFSRAGWLAGILALMGLAIIYPKFILKLGLVVVPVFLLVAGIFLQDQLAWAGQRLISSESERSAFSRLPVYAAAVGMFQAKPFLGWGYGNFDRFDRQFQPSTVANISGDNKDHASHNFFLSMIAEQGLVGILLYLIPVFYWLRLTVKHFSKLPRDGFWSRKILVIFWMTILSHIVVYNFANMRVVFGLGAWWLTLGLIARFMDFHQHFFAQEPAMVIASQQMGFTLTKREQSSGHEQNVDSR
jgi:O-antigen ligase